MIYVANINSENGTVIDGATNATTTVNAGVGPESIAVNPVTNKIYVANAGFYLSNNGSVTVIDGATNSTTSVNAGPNPTAVAVNPLTNSIYAVNGNRVTIIDGTS